MYFFQGVQVAVRPIDKSRIDLSRPLLLELKRASIFRKRLFICFDNTNLQKQNENYVLNR